MKGGSRLRKALYRLCCIICTLLIILSSISAVQANKDIDDGTPSDSPEGRMSALYGYVLNDYINTYGVISDEFPYGNNTITKKTPEGVLYADIVNFDANDTPYLVIFIADKEYNCASCHIWSYADATEKVKRVAVINEKYPNVSSRRGGFYLGWNGDKRYILFKQYSGDKIYDEKCYTVVDGQGALLLEKPQGISDTAVMDISRNGVTAYTDVSGYNRVLTEFFDSLKNAAANSVSYPDITGRISEEDEDKLEQVTAKAAQYGGNFNIADYMTSEEYETAAVELRGISKTDKHYVMSNVYALGAELYYIRYSTDAALYNYLLVRRTDAEVGSYQILRISSDCIPLADRELVRIKDEYLQNPMLYKKAKTALVSEEYERPSSSPVSTAAAQKRAQNKANNQSFAIDARYRKPAAFIGAALVIALMTALWIYYVSMDDND